MVSVHDASFERIKAFSVDDPVLQPGHQEPDAILAHSVDAFNIGTVLRIVSLEHSTAEVDDFELVLRAVSMQEP